MIGFTASVLVSTVALHTNAGVSIPFCIAMTAGSCLGSYIPDMDHPGSKLGRKIAIISHPINLISRAFKSVHKKTKGKVSLWFSELFGHRGLFHAPLFWGIIMAILLNWIPSLFLFAPAANLSFAILVGISLGIGMHLLADMFNPTGIPIFAPFTFYKIHLGKLVTGSGAEWFVVGGCALVLIINTAIVFTLLR